MVRATLVPLIRKCCLKLPGGLLLPSDWPGLCGMLRKLSDPHGGRRQGAWDLGMAVRPAKQQHLPHSRCTFSSLAPHR